jgi:hypothetical protein
MRLELARAFDRAPASWAVSLHESTPPQADVVVAAPDMSIDGAIAFDPDDPDALIATIHDALATNARQVIGIAGARGGSGATTLTLHLAARAGTGSCVIETPGAGVAERLGFESDHVDWRNPDIELAALSVPGGFRVLLAPHNGDVDEMAGVVDRARRTFDTVLIDLAVPRVMPKFVDVAILVMPPTIPGARSASDLLASAKEVPWAVVTNRTGRGGESSRAQLQNLIGRRVTLELSHTPALRDSEDDDRLLTSEFHPWVRRAGRLWESIKQR